MACQEVCVRWYFYAHAVVVVQVGGCDGERANKDSQSLLLSLGGGISGWSPEKNTTAGANES